ncbi:putative ribonuclease H-like domain-containing protein [Tanacetum coccineum]
MALKAVLMKTGLKFVNTARPVNTVRSVNTGRPFSTARSFNTVRPSYTAHPKSTIHYARPRTYFQNQAQSTVYKPFYKRTTLTERCFNQRFNTSRPFRSTVNTVRVRGFNVVKPSACWVWRPIKSNGASLSNSQLNDKGFVDSGCSRHMTGNITHISDFKDFDGGYVTFGGGAYGGRITSKGTIKTNNLDFDDVYFVKELKFKLFSISQMCDKKNYVLFTDSEFLIQGHTQEEGIDYDEVFAPVARIEAIRMFLAYASYMGFMVYQIDVKSAFLYGQIQEEVYVCQPPGFEDLDHPDKVYKLVKALYGLYQAPRAWYDTLTNYLLCNGFQRGKIDQTLFIKRQIGHILLVQIYVDDVIFGSTKKELYVKSASTPIDLEKPLVQDGDAADVNEHLYRSTIGSLMYLIASRPDIMCAVCACARFQVSLKTSHLLAIKIIFRYLKGKPSLRLWYSKESPLELVAYINSDYAGATQDRKSTTGGCQFLGNRLISWQCKKQTVVATSTTETEYVAVANCCGQIDTEHNVADLLTKGFDAGRFQYLVSSIGMLNP